MKEKFCIIPARGGSKRFEKKNLTLFRGKTLVAYTIEQAKQSGIFEHIIVSSDDREILKIAADYSVELHNRAETLASDTAKIIDVVREIIRTRPIPDGSAVGVLLTTCPLRSIIDIAAAYNIFKNSGSKKSVVSVRKSETPVQLSWKIRNSHLTPVLPDEFAKSTRKQDHYATYFFNDAIIIDSAQNFLLPLRNLFGDNPLPYEMPWERSIAIDYEFQMKIVKCLSKMEG
jgi:CMP-N-acetylneuraminic acid synthetase